MDNVRILIVDDELQSRSLIKKLLSLHFPKIIVDEAENVTSAIEKIHQFNLKLVFLDVQMRGETGFDLLDKIGEINFEIIFTTAHSEFALKAFRYSALDYLMKPIVCLRKLSSVSSKAFGSSSIGDNKSKAHVAA